MRLTTQLWSPDTHAEDIYTSFDASLPQEQHVHTCVTVTVLPDRAGPHFRKIPRGHRHQFSDHKVPGAHRDHKIGRGHDFIHHPDHCKTIYETILAENQLKNRSLDTLETALPEWAKEQVTRGGDLLFEDPDGEQVIVIGSGDAIRVRDNMPHDPLVPLKPIMQAKAHHRPVWAFDPEVGEVTLHVPLLSPEHHADLEKHVRAAHGHKVRLSHKPLAR